MGLSVFNPVAMSVVVYAGSSQLIGAGFIAAAAPALSTVVTTFVVNLWHMLYAVGFTTCPRKWFPDRALICGRHKHRL